MLSEAAREAKRAYMRAWRAANPDKVKAYQERYWSMKSAQNGPKSPIRAAEAGEAKC